MKRMLSFLFFLYSLILFSHSYGFEIEQTFKDTQIDNLEINIIYSQLITWWNFKTQLNNSFSLEVWEMAPNRSRLAGSFGHSVIFFKNNQNISQSYILSFEVFAFTNLSYNKLILGLYPITASIYTIEDFLRNSVVHQEHFKRWRYDLNQEQINKIMNFINYEIQVYSKNEGRQELGFYSINKNNCTTRLIWFLSEIGIPLNEDLAKTIRLPKDLPSFIEETFGFSFIDDLGFRLNLKTINEKFSKYFNNSARFSNASSEENSIDLILWKYLYLKKSMSSIFLREKIEQSKIENQKINAENVLKYLGFKL